ARATGSGTTCVSGGKTPVSSCTSEIATGITLPPSLGMNIHSSAMATDSKTSKTAHGGRGASAADQHAPATRPSQRAIVTDKREAILHAALELFVERGFWGTAVPEIAEKAGVGAGTIYRYFESKEALVNALY